MQQLPRMPVDCGGLQRAPKSVLPETATAETLEKLLSAIAAKHLRRLERFAHDDALRGASVTCAAVWG